MDQRQTPILEENVGSRHDVAGAKTEHAHKDCRILLLNHEQRDVQECLTEIKSVSPSQDVLAVSAQIPGKTNPRTKVFVVIVRQGCCQRIVDGFELEIGSAVGLGLCADEVVVFVPTCAE